MDGALAILVTLVLEVPAVPMLLLVVRWAVILENHPLEGGIPCSHPIKLQLKL